MQRRPWTAARIVGGVRRYGPVAVADFVAVTITYALAIALRTGAPQQVLAPTLEPFSVVVVAAAGVLQVLSNVLFAVYWRDWSAAALEDMVALVKATGFVLVALLLFNLGTQAHWIPTLAVLAGASLSFFVQAALHLKPRWSDIARAAFGRPRQAERVIAVGAGRLGQLLAADLAHGVRDYRIVCFVDDDARKVGAYVRGIRVAGRVADLADLVDQYGASTVVLSVAHPPGELVRRVMDIAEQSDIRVRRVSGLDLLRRDTSPLRAIEIEELMTREPVTLVDSVTRATYERKRILVTGAAGSIGSELARQLVALRPERLILLDSNESALHALSLELSDESVAVVLGDVRDRNWLLQELAPFRPDVVFHAAAYKHVPMLEAFPLAGLATNVLGTANVLDVARAVGVERLVFVSTDKAVEPTSVLGHTKRFGELLTTVAGRDRDHSYASVRFGNVLGSVGSVVPLFAQQIDRGGPVTVTHAEATRYLMTIHEAVGLLIVAGGMAQGGDLLVLDMGDPVSILALARRMIRLRGLRTPSDIEIRYVGLRPGEKLHESLIASNEAAEGTEHPRIIRVKHVGASPSQSLDEAVRAIAARVQDHDAEGALDVLRAVTATGGIAARTMTSSR